MRAGDAVPKRTIPRRAGRLLPLALALAGTAVLAAGDAAGPITRRVLMRAEKVIGLIFTDDERELMLDGLNERLRSFEAIRGISLPNSVAPAIQFNPLGPGETIEPGDGDPGDGEPVRSRVAPPPVPADLEEIAFLPVTQLAELIRTRAVTSVELTRMYLERIRRLDPHLKAVVTLTEDLALKQAARADREIAAGRYRGPLHGIPWGAKDLLATRGIPTTWGATPFKDQIIDDDATVVRRLEEAGAVLVAKLTLGALAWGDVWFGGRTNNPWNLEEGSSGSSAGPGAATAAGLVGFSIGSETWGSIVSPASRCGTTGLRPTFGRISRHGAMALSWTMDKLGPMCRSVEDCALVFEAIHGPDGRDPTVVEAPFRWNADLDVRTLRVGYVRSLFEAAPAEDDDPESRANDLAALDALRGMGIDLVPIELPNLPVDALSLILSAEAGAAFDELTRSGRDDLLERQIEDAWPNVLRQARLIPAVEYIQANRIRSLLMSRMADILREIDVYVAPSFGGDNLLLTNLTGHPAVVLPNGFRENGTPTSITFTGRLFGEDRLLALARAYQEATGFHLKHPPIDELIAKIEKKENR
jgi:Asp-tRNA(Asn)/Glu-tRNA(Gln) amidotransferase A subunit family amidase